MKEWRSQHIFPHPWELMIQAALRKYPNRHNPNVHSIDVLRVEAAPSKILLHRLFATLWNLPPLAFKFIGINETTFVNESIEIDRNTKTYTLHAKNYTFSSMIEVDETLVYTPCPSEPNKTQLSQSVNITVKNVPLLSGYLEGLMCTNYDEKAKKGRIAVEEVARGILMEQY